MPIGRRVRPATCGQRKPPAIEALWKAGFAHVDYVAILDAERWTT